MSTKRRAETTTSERQLVLALADRGRPVALSMLANWRRDGILPPLAHHGLGTGKGKTYYWQEEDIVERACRAHDLMQRYGRPDIALRLLWLSGYDVPLQQLRRAWRAIGKTGALWRIRPATDCNDHPSRRHNSQGAHDDQPLLNLILSACEGLASDDGAATDIAADTIHLLLAHGGPSAAPGGAPSCRRAAILFRIVGSALEASNLVANATDKELKDAQRYFGRIARPLASGQGDPFVWSLELAEHVGAPLFLLVLTLLRSGQRAVLDQAAADFGAVSLDTMLRAAKAAPATAHLN
jgi:hypothetical protein